jgi:RNA polymerase sigma factor (sigma-70 family)
MICDDMALVREYGRSNSEQAFATLVSRHVNLVYSVALRQVRDPYMAEEITQGVFILLARKAKSLGPKTILSGWLCRTARYVSADALKIQRRRQSREKELQMQSTLNESEPAVWNQIAPLLDDALNCLGQKEHDAIVLRFFDGKELKQVGAAMGIREDAARMRVNRGLERLRKFFAKRGVMVSAGAISGAISLNSIQAAPTGLATIITGAALCGTTAITTAVIAASKTATMTTLQKTIITGLIAAAACTGIYQTRQVSRLRERNQTLEGQQTPLTEQILQLKQERDGLERKLADLRDAKELQRLRKEHLELMSLRGSVRQLTDALRQLKTSGAQAEPANSASEASDADSILFSASLTNHVPNGQTLVVGGWSMNGMRGYLLLTSTIGQSEGGSDGQPLAVQSQVVGAPESFWNQIGWTDAKSDARRSSVAGVLTSEQLETLLTALKATEGSELSNTSLAKGRDGERVGIGFTLSDDRAEGALMGIDLYPHIGADGQSLELEVRPSAASTNTEIYPSLLPPPK